MTQKTLIAVVTAIHREHWRKAIRETWLPMVPQGVDVVFFMGTDKDVLLAGDEVYLNCDDSYQGLPEKIRSICKYAYDYGYEYMLKCDDDTVLNPKELLASGYEKHKYSGRANRYPNADRPFTVPVGFNWWIDRDCMEIIKESALPADGSNDDEKWVASKLHEYGISLVNAPGYEIHMGIDEWPERKGHIKLYRPLKPPPIPKFNSDAFSWTVFMEADSGDAIPLEKKLAEFHKVFGMFKKTNAFASV